jgi:hypothetical protein
MREIRTSDSTRGRLAADSSLLSVLPYYRPIFLHSTAIVTPAGL